VNARNQIEHRRRIIVTYLVGLGGFNHMVTGRVLQLAFLPFPSVPKELAAIQSEEAGSVFFYSRFYTFRALFSWGEFPGAE
jgi:hypothetical protein